MPLKLRPPASPETLLQRTRTNLGRPQFRVLENKLGFNWALHANILQAAWLWVVSELSTADQGESKSRKSASSAVTVTPRQKGEVLLIDESQTGVDSLSVVPPLLQRKLIAARPRSFKRQLQRRLINVGSALTGWRVHAIRFDGQVGRQRLRLHRLATTYSRADKCALTGETMKLLTEDILAVSQLDLLAFAPPPHCSHHLHKAFPFHTDRAVQSEATQRRSLPPDVAPVTPTHMLQFSSWRHLKAASSRGGFFDIRKAKASGEKKLRGCRRHYSERPLLNLLLSSSLHEDKCFACPTLGWIREDRRLRLATAGERSCGGSSGV